MSLRDKILAEAKGAPLPVPGWDGVYMRRVCASEEIAWREAYEDRPRSHSMAGMVLLSAVDEKGERIFADDDLSAILQVPMAVLMELFAVAMQANARNIKG